MALPPTPLTELLYSARPRTAEGFVDTLQASGCLAPRHRKRGLAAIQSGIDQNQRRPDHPGPTLEDDVAAALTKANVLDLSHLPKTPYRR